MVHSSQNQALGLRERKKLRTRATLIDAAVELCDRQGFDNTTVDQMAAIADVSPRTFSRYFATKDAIALALIDEVADRVARQLASQPPHVNHLEALLRSYVAMATSAKQAAPGDWSAERLMCIARITLSSPALRQVTVDYRANAVDAELAKRMGVDLGDRRLKLVSAIWGAILMTALTDHSDGVVDWRRLTVDIVIARVETTFAEYVDEVASLGQPV